MGMTSSVNDLLAFSAAVMNRHDEENGIDPSQRQPLLNNKHKNPLRQIIPSWSRCWTQPIDDGFENDTAYCLGWYETTMPSSAVGLVSYNHRRRRDAEQWVIPYIIGKDSPKRTLYGHNGVANGGTATMYLLPESHSAVVALSNAADTGDAAETTAQILLQALFDMTPKVDLLIPLQEEAKRTLQDHDDMIKSWRKGRDVSNPQAPSEDYVGTYVGLNISRIDIVPSEHSTSGLAVVFGQQEDSRCELEYYNTDAFSFLPLEHDDKMARGMIDWDYHRVGIFEFVRDEQVRAEPVVALRWQWDRYECPTMYTKQ